MTIFTILHNEESEISRDFVEAHQDDSDVIEVSSYPACCDVAPEISAFPSVMYTAPEHTLPAFTRAAYTTYDGIEVEEQEVAARVVPAGLCVIRKPETLQEVKDDLAAKQALA